jgi:microcin C transport system permease protein
MNELQPLHARQSDPAAPPARASETAPAAAGRRPWLSPLNQRRWRNFRANRRAFWSLIIFATLYFVSLFAEFLANDRPILVNYRGEMHYPIFQFYPETAFGGEFRTQAVFRSAEVQCLIRTGGAELCLDDPADALAEAAAHGTVEGEPIHEGWMLWPPIRSSFNTVNDLGGPAPSPPDSRHWLGTDDTARDVHRADHLRLPPVGHLRAGGCRRRLADRHRLGRGAGLLWRAHRPLLPAPDRDLVLDPVALRHHHRRRHHTDELLAARLPDGAVQSWTALVGVVRAEFLRARNFEYVRAARALGVSNARIMFRHVLPNAMVATLTLLPFIVTGAIAALATLDFLGFGMPASAPSLGELTLQAKRTCRRPGSASRPS